MLEFIFFYYIYSVVCSVRYVALNYEKSIHEQHLNLDTGLPFRVCLQEQSIGFLLYGTRQGKEVSLRQSEI